MKSSPVCPHRANLSISTVPGDLAMDAIGICEQCERARIAQKKAS